jgi:hypothetical protein
MSQPRKVETCEHWIKKIRELFEMPEREAKVETNRDSDFEIVPRPSTQPTTSGLSEIKIPRSSYLHRLEMSLSAMRPQATRDPRTYRSRSRSPSSHLSSERPVRSRSPFPPPQEQHFNEEEDIRSLELLLLQAKVKIAKKEEEIARAEEDVLKLRLHHATEKSPPDP